MSGQLNSSPPKTSVTACSALFNLLINWFLTTSGRFIPFFTFNSRLSTSGIHTYPAFCVHKPGWNIHPVVINQELKVMQQVTTKSFAQILATTRKVGLFLLILAFVTGAASVQAKPPSDDPSPTETEGIPEVLAVLGAIQLKLETIEADQRNIDAIIDQIYTTTGQTRVAVGQVKLTTEAIKGTTETIKGTTETIKGTTGDTKAAIVQVKSVSDSTKSDVETLIMLANLNLDEALFSIDICFDVGLGVGSDFGMDAAFAFNAEGRVGAEAFGNGVIGKVYGDVGLKGSLKANLGANAVGVACLDIKALAALGIQDDIKNHLDDLVTQLRINPTTLANAMAELPNAATSLLLPDLSLLDLSSASDFDVLLEALPRPPGIEVADVKNLTSDILGEFDGFAKGFKDITAFCSPLSNTPENLGIPLMMREAMFDPMCDVHNQAVSEMGDALQEAMDIIDAFNESWPF